MAEGAEAQGAAPRRMPPAVERFVKAFEDSRDATEENVKAVAALLEMIGHKDNGLIAAIDDLCEVNELLVAEIRGLRKDLRASARARGLSNIFDLLT